MVDADVRLDSVVVLAVPGAGGLVQVERVAQGELSETGLLDDVRVMDDDFHTNIIAVRHALRQDRADVLPVHVVFVHASRPMGEDDRLAPVAGKAVLVEDVLRQAQLPSGAAVGVPVLKDTHGRDDGLINQIAFLGPVGIAERDAVQTLDTLENRGFHFARSSFLPVLLCRVTTKTSSC